MLGAGPWTTFRHITLPMLTPAIGAAALLVFIFCFTSFGVILILGGPRFATLEVEIYRQAVNLFNLPVAAALSLVQILFIFVFMFVYSRLQARTGRPLSLQSQQVTQHKPQTGRQKLLVWGNVVFMVTLLGVPLMALVLRSFTVAGQFSPAYYQALFSTTPKRESLFFVPPTEGVFNSLTFAASTVILATFLGLLVAIALTRSNGRSANGQVSKWANPKSHITHLASQISHPTPFHFGGYCPISPTQNPCSIPCLCCR